MANRTINFLPSDPNWVTKLLPFKASTALQMGTAIVPEISGNTTTGNYTKSGVENATGADFAGILMEEIASTDADYATAGKLKLVAVPLNRKATAKFTATSGTFTAADVGKTVELDSNARGLAVDTAGKGARITKYITSTRGECQFTLPETETA